jgi:glutaredoxin
MVWRWLFGRRAGPATPADIVLYTRQGCHLCADALATLESAGRSFPLTVRSIDVDSDPELAAKYGLEVPVVLVDGRLRFRGRINRVLLERLLRQRTESG